MLSPLVSTTAVLGVYRRCTMNVGTSTETDSPSLPVHKPAQIQKTNIHAVKCSEPQNNLAM